MAGLSAAFGARKAGHEVTIVSALPGASALAGGAVDDRPWEDLVRSGRLLGAQPAATALGEDVADLIAAFSLWSVPARDRVQLATLGGRVRPARGCDRALLDLGGLHDTTVILPRAPRAAWDADALAAAFSADASCRARGLRFRAVDAPVLRFDDERRVGDLDLAARHDDPARLGWLGARLREARSEGVGAVLLGPWLGAREPRAAALSEIAGVPAGEALSGVGSAAGLRFEAARNRLLDELGAQRLDARVMRLVPGARAISAELDRDLAPIEAEAAVLAVGGLTGGGLVYAPPEHGAGADLPKGSRAPFRLSLDAPVRLSLSGDRHLDAVSSFHGPNLDESAWPSPTEPGVLETVGVLSDGPQAAPRIFVAGEVMAARPRTVLEAVASGLAAARAAFG